MGTQKNPLNERVLFSIQNIRKKLWVRKYFKFYAENVCLSKHVLYISLLSSANYLLITRQVTSDHHLKFNFLNTALKELGPFLFDMLIPGIHMEQGLHNKIIKKVYTINNGWTTENLWSFEHDKIKRSMVSCLKQYRANPFPAIHDKWVSTWFPTMWYFE